MPWLILKPRRTRSADFVKPSLKIVLVNFGTGYSSLYHLRNFKLDKIKIDRSFVESWEARQESSKIINALVGSGHGLGLTVSVDGIGNMDQGVSLRDTGCERGQGFMFGGAVPAGQTRDYLLQEQHAVRQSN